MRAAIAVALVAACGSSAPGADANPPANTGFVTLIEMHVLGTTMSSANASFAMGNVFGQPTGAAGECTMYRGNLTSTLSAGTIDITGTTVPLSLVPSGSPPQYTASTFVPEPIFVQGSTITMTAPGAQFPAFTLQVTAPAPLDGFTPPASISRAAGYHATWTVGTGKIWLLLGGNDAGTNVYLQCRVADSGSYLVTPDELALIPASITMVTLNLARAGERDESASDSEVIGVAMDDVVADNQIALTP
jgi:hypothetical protein